MSGENVRTFVLQTQIAITKMATLSLSVRIKNALENIAEVMEYVNNHPAFATSIKCVRNLNAYLVLSVGIIKPVILDIVLML